MINHSQLTTQFAEFGSNDPFPYCIIDNFVSEELAKNLENEFLAYESPKWHVYKNAIEDKKTLNDWNAFPPTTYKFFQYLNSSEFVGILSGLIGAELFPDPGLHGGGWHIHATGGNLNPHLDYSLHPKLNLQRKINIILYVSSDLKSEYGGHLGFWKHDETTHRPGKLVCEIEPKFARAVIFDTAQNSWHGMSRGLVQPAGIYRKSLASYFLCPPPVDVDQRGRALFAPREEQQGDAAIEALIQARANIASSNEVYRT